MTESAYADDRNLRARLGVFAYAETPVDPGWRTSLVDWDGTQVVADIGCGAGFDLRQILPTGRCRHAFAVDLSAGMLGLLSDLEATGRVTLVEGDAQCLPLADGSVDVALAMHMLYHVPAIATAVKELRRITKPGGTVLVSTNSSHSMAEIHDLLDAVVSEHLGRPARALPELRFDAETGTPVLQVEFAKVTLHRRVVPLAFPSPEPVIAYLNSVRDPISAASVRRSTSPWRSMTFAARVQRVIDRKGHFRAHSTMGVFVCR